MIKPLTISPMKKKKKLITTSQSQSDIFKLLLQWANSLKLIDSLIIVDKDKQQILTIKKLEPANTDIFE